MDFESKREQLLNRLNTIYTLDEALDLIEETNEIVSTYDSFRQAKDEFYSDRTTIMEILKTGMPTTLESSIKVEDWLFFKHNDTVLFPDGKVLVLEN